MGLLSSPVVTCHRSFASRRAWMSLRQVSQFCGPSNVAKSKVPWSVVHSM